ncbi:hypothetical protein Ancab_025371 [Ancistrocladus abbreviatus]
MQRVKGKRGWMAIKVVLERAYNKVSWSLIHDTLVEMGLPDDIILFGEASLSQAVVIKNILGQFAAASRIGCANLAQLGSWYSLYCFFQQGFSNKLAWKLLVPDDSLLVKGISSISPLFLQGIKWVVDNGSKIHFCCDPWLDDISVVEKHASKPVQPHEHHLHLCHFTIGNNDWKWELLKQVVPNGMLQQIVTVNPPHAEGAH